MVSSTGTTITHPRPPPLSGLTGTTTAPSTNTSPSPAQHTHTHTSTPSPLPVSSKKHSTHTQDSESVSVATAISFATPENSPFLANKNKSISNDLNLNSNPLHTSNSNRIHGHGGNSINTSDKITMDTVEGGVLGVTVSGGTCRGHSNSSHSHNNTIATQTALAQSVTPQEKAVKFKGSNDGHINEASSSQPLSSGHDRNPLVSAGDGNADVTNEHGVQQYGNVGDTGNLNNRQQQQQQVGGNRGLGDCLNYNASGGQHLTPTTSITNSDVRTFATSPLSSRGRRNRAHHHRQHLQQQKQQQPDFSSSFATGNVSTAPNPQGQQSSIASASTPAPVPAPTTSQPRPQLQIATGLGPVTTGFAKSSGPHEVPRTLTVSTSSSSLLTSSSSSPSRIPSLRPRKLSESMPHQHQQHVSSACSDAGSVSVPPSLCSSTCSPQNDGKEDERRQQQHQEVGHVNANSVGQAQAIGHGKLDNDAQQVGVASNDGSSQAVDPNILQSGNRVNEKQACDTANSHIQQNKNTINKNSTEKNSNANSSGSSSGTGPSHKNRTASPPPPSSSRLPQPQARTPVRSPVASRYGRLSVETAPFSSPGIFLSPYLPSPPDSRKAGGGGGGGGTTAGQKNTTPTNFAKDFGKGDLGTSSFDATNALPWLSPTAYSLFSPGGGIASAINTPGGMFCSIPRSPRTPNGSRLTLPLTTEAVGADSKKKTPGISSMICVSPLASRKSSNGGISIKVEKPHNVVGNHHATAPDTPINFQEVFASPKTDSRGMIQTDQSNEIPTLGHPNEAASNEELSSRLSLEKHMAERDVREDEDLNVLLKLAETTPNRRVAPSKQSSRSFQNPHTYKHPGSMYPLPTSGEPPASLHLPCIGKNGTIISTGKGRKKTATSTKSGDFTASPLPIRTSKSSSPSKSSKSSADKSKSKVQKKKGPFQQNPGHPKAMYPYPGAPGHVPHPPAGVYPHPPPHFMHPPPGAYYSYPPPHPGSHAVSGHPPPPPYPTIYSGPPVPPGPTSDTKKGQKPKGVAPKSTGIKRQANSPNTEARKRTKKSTSRKGGKRTRTTVTQPLTGPEREKSAATITAINAATGNKNDKAASLASAILRGVTMRPSGKWQAQLYYAGKSRYIGVFDTREKAALAYEIAREKLKTDKPASEQSAQSIKETEANVNAARKAAFEGVNEKDPRNAK
eukprot:CAMPEP_0203670306 /NCGR_PEP_ID=MMETSP0090-20130426/6417_1 /ASSEMBLY_ACC=CAM_ASM_001088 /TAXON_ID=426623 /ORGANISM="Chaetoceros affinis, Strain CCMP159" /LENGTH=1184 /DNA_ID=CAMNT_0050535135 /DNA_START=580 /DNA_END=4134 /DNA_ORIENTATION=+